ncbi:hypothetical protein HMPREF1230_1327 [Streptococcus pyogenes GA19681]|nr:hypothetical protein HMPREF1230_1327 [Streptococcus pyogenes GA19681]
MFRTSGFFSRYMSNGHWKGAFPFLGEINRKRGISSERQ